MSNKVRVDKWLWCVRLFKTRSLSTTMCKNSRISYKDKNLKPSFLLAGGEVIQVHKEGFNLSIKVIKLIDKRVGAALAVECYENLTPLEEMNKYKDWFMGKARAEFRDKGAGRPTKKDRRELEDFKEDFLLEDLWDEKDEGESASDN